MRIVNFKPRWFKEEWWGYKRRRKPVPLAETHFEDGLSDVEITDPGTSEVIVDEVENTVELIPGDTEAPCVWVDCELPGAHVEVEAEVVAGDEVVIVVNGDEEHPATADDDGLATVVIDVAEDDPLIGVTVDPESTGVTLGGITVRPRLF